MSERPKEKGQKMRPSVPGGGSVFRTWARSRGETLGGPLGMAGDERGAALAIALMVMVICALLGAASIMTSTTDIQVATNDRTYHEALMNADGGIHWLRTQNLANMSSFTDTQRNAVNTQNETTGGPHGIHFLIPANPTFAWSDPTAGGTAVFRVRSRGLDRNQRGMVEIEAEIRVAPPAGAVEEAGCITCYP